MSARTLCLTIACCLPGGAGALFPCVKTVSSNNGSFIVIVEPEPGESHRVFLNVLARVGFLTRFVAPNTFWTNWTHWSVVLDPGKLHKEPECPLPLITDDGEFLILLQTGPTFATDRAVLQIYRRRDHPGDLMREGPDHGVFIKDIPLADLWPEDRVDANTGAWDDETPQWFAGGTFEFSTDGQELIHKTRWHSIVRIHLEDGFVDRQ
jgi:hypothetical protein